MRGQTHPNDKFESEQHDRAAARTTLLEERRGRRRGREGGGGALRRVPVTARRFSFLKSLAVAAGFLYASEPGRGKKG